MEQFKGNLGSTRITILSIVRFIWIAHAWMQMSGLGINVFRVKHFSLAIEIWPEEVLQYRHLKLNPPKSFLNIAVLKFKFLSKKKKKY